MTTEADDRKSRAFFLRTRKEALVAGAIWAFFFVWVVGVSYVMGYGEIDPTLFMGFPAWVFWGIFLPFIIATIVNCLYAFVYLVDEDDKI